MPAWQEKVGTVTQGTSFLGNFRHLRETYSQIKENKQQKEETGRKKGGKGNMTRNAMHPATKSPHLAGGYIHE